MTVRFRTAWNGHQVGEIATLNGGLETSLIAGGIAESYTAPTVRTDFSSPPEQPGEGTFTLKSIDNLLTWVEDV